MKQDTVEAILVIDRSGSMQSIKKGTIDGINEFLESMRTNGLITKITLVQFDDKYDVLVNGTDASMVQNLTEQTFIPRGMTALHDAIGKTINTVGERLRNTPESERPSKVMFAIFTDGQENASNEFNGDAIKKMITHQQDKYSWNFVFVGANQDSILTAQSMGISAGSAINYSNSNLGVNNVARGVTEYAKSFYAGDSNVRFSASARLDAMATDNVTITPTITATDTLTLSNPSLTVVDDTKEN